MLFTNFFVTQTLHQGRFPESKNLPKKRMSDFDSKFYIFGQMYRKK